MTPKIGNDYFLKCILYFWIIYQFSFCCKPHRSQKVIFFYRGCFVRQLDPFSFSQLTHPNNLRTSCVKPAGAQNLAILGLQHAVKMNFAKMFVKKLAFPQIYIQVQWSKGHHPSDIENFTWKERESSDICIKEVSSCQKEWNTKKKVERFLQLEWGFLEGSLFLFFLKSCWW